MSSLSNDHIEDHGFQLTADMKQKIIRDDGSWLDFCRCREDRSKVTDDHLIRLIKEDAKAEDLTNIDLSFCTAITDKALHWIAQRCPQLKTLHVVGCNVTDVGISDIAETFNNKLKGLSFNGCDKVTDGILDVIATHCTGLEFLFASDCGIRSVPNNIGNLQQIQELFLHDNQITELPRSIVKLKDTCEDFLIDNNPLQYPPLAVATQGFDAIEKYFKDNDDQGATYDNADGGISDSPDSDPDRLGRKVYAEAISTVTRSIESPNTSICVGLYGRWGSGKTFLYNLIQKVDAEYTDGKNKERLDKLKEEAKNKMHIKPNECSLQFVCNAINFLVYCCNCCKRSRDTSSTAQAKSIATRFVLLFPIWIFLYIVSLPFSFIKEFLFVWSVKNETKQSEGGKQPCWRDVKCVLTGDTAIYINENQWSSCCSLDTFQLLVLSSTRRFFKLIELIFSYIPTIFCRSEPFERDDNMRKSLYLECNAWLYNGTDLLWASLLEEMWVKVEEEFGVWRVRFHRFTIEISCELKSDDIFVRKKKRHIAGIKFVLKQVFCLILAIVATAVITIYNETIEEFAGNIYRKYILNIALYAPSVILFLKNTRKLYLQLVKSRGAWIFEEAQSLEKNHQRADLSKKTGFMGTVKIEVGYFVDFLKTEPIIDCKHQLHRFARLFIFVDDLDRCSAETIMHVLQAIMLLLLVDAPITCFLAIDSHYIVASIEKLLGEQFRKEGIDGYSFLDKIVHLPFCIPDLDKRRKTTFLQILSEKNELDPLRICQRLKHWGIDKKYTEFDGLVPFEELKEPFPKEEKMIKELARVLDLMIKRRILDHDDDAEACFRSPKNVLDIVDDRVNSQQPLSDQLEEEFLSCVSSGIQKILLSRSSSRPEPSPFSKDVADSPSHDDTPSDAGIVIPTPSVPPLGQIPEGEVTGEAEVADEDKVYHPMMDNFESSWFEIYADHMVGEPRKMKRITNSYMVSRIIAKELSPNLFNSKGSDFRRKLMKMIILFEQWPYRMAWLIVIVQNLQQELSLKEEGNSNPIGKNLTSIIFKLFKKEKEEEIMALSLIDVYYQLVQTLIHSPEEARVELQRDRDPQVFEILLAESDALLVMKDIASISCTRVSGTLRPYVFNLQTHMMEKVENYFDSCMVHTVKEKDKEQEFGVYHQKHMFYSQNYPNPSQVSRAP